MALKACNIVKVTVHVLVTTPLDIPFVYKKVGSHYPSENQGKIISSLIIFHRKFCFDFISFAGSFSFFDTLRFINFEVFIIPSVIHFFVFDALKSSFLATPRLFGTL